MEIETRLSPCGEKIWYEKNNRNYWHREDGPAYISSNNKTEWWYYHDINYMNDPSNMPLNLFLAYVKWEYRKNG